MVWTVGTRQVSLDRPLVVGILNLTPDSFSGDGLADVPVGAAVARARALVGDGADIVDIGGESTRPGADPVDPTVEIERVIPVVAELAGSVPISVDTYHPEVAEAALATGADIVNDVTGFTDPAMVDIATSGCGVVVMCGRSLALDTRPDADAVTEVEQFLLDRVETLTAAGVASDRIVLDPGLGFAKTHAQSLALLGGVGRLASHGLPVMIGASRKGFLRSVLDADSWTERDRASATISALAYRDGARLFRVHNVAATRSALRVVAAIVTSH